MQTLNVRQFRSIMPSLKQALDLEHELILVSNGVPVARVLPIDASPAPSLPSLAAFRDSLGKTLPNSTPELRAERDAR